MDWQKAQDSTRGRVTVQSPARTVRVRVPFDWQVLHSESWIGAQ